MRASFRDATSGRGLLTTACVSFVLAMIGGLPAAASEMLFPQPLHITREITDPISESTVTVDEYCHGNRIAAVEGPRTAIVDYERGEITSIDRSRGTFSITSFEAVAAAQQGAENRRKPVGDDSRSEPDQPGRQGPSPRVSGVRDLRERGVAVSRRSFQARAGTA